jgi:hypothetical protein
LKRPGFVEADAAGNLVISHSFSNRVQVVVTPGGRLSVAQENAATAQIRDSITCAKKITSWKS